MSEIWIEEVDVVDPEVIQALRRLIPQLSQSAPTVEAYDLESIVTAPDTTLFVARSDAGIVGTLTLVLFRSPSGARGWIEDVVVDVAVRGQGVGEALVDAAIALARKASSRTLDLTSNPKREGANRLYVRCGFVQRETNVYRFSLEG
ncbi:MAG: GNAT family N-acetyltransferase [Actinomycetes bacterium]